MQEKQEKSKRLTTAKIDRVIARRARQVKDEKIARRRRKKRDYERKNKFEKGHDKHGGRPPGASNRFTREFKEAMAIGMELIGNDNPEGKRGVAGFFYWLGKAHPALLLEYLIHTTPKEMPRQPNGEPVRFVAIPEAFLSRIPESELIEAAAMFGNYGRVANGHNSSPPMIEAKKNEYAEMIDDDDD